MTIVDIAEKSGYSVTTVSRVLNNRRDVSKKARNRIVEIVDEYHFVPNNNAKYLKQTVSKNILVLVKGTFNQLFSDMVEEIQNEINRTDYVVTVIYLDEDDNEVTEGIRLCRERKPAGMLFLGGNPDCFRQEFRGIMVPCVLVTNQGKGLGFSNLSSVATDDFAAAEKAVDYLFEQGHEQIGVIGGDVTASNTSRQRLRGCKSSYRKHGKKFDDKNYYAIARFDFNSAHQAMTRLLEGGKNLTAVFAMSDVMAIGAIRAIKDFGLRVPEDISIMGFDGTALADYYNPKLATIRQKYKVIAKRSLEILLRTIETKKGAVHEIVPFEVVPGESVRRQE